MDTHITKKASQMVSVDDLPKLGKVIKDFGMPLLILLGICYMLFTQNLQGEEDKKAVQSKADDCMTEMINLLKEQNGDITKALQEQNILQRETNELMRDIKHELKK